MSPGPEGEKREKVHFREKISPQKDSRIYIYIYPISSLACGNPTYPLSHQRTTTLERNTAITAGREDNPGRCNSWWRRQQIGRWREGQRARSQHGHVCSLRGRRGDYVLRRGLPAVVPSCVFGNGRQAGRGSLEVQPLLHPDANGVCVCVRACVVGYSWLVLFCISLRAFGFHLSNWPPPDELANQP